MNQRMINIGLVAALVTILLTGCGGTLLLHLASCDCHRDHSSHDHGHCNHSQQQRHQHDPTTCQICIKLTAIGASMCLLFSDIPAIVPLTATTTAIRLQFPVVEHRFSAITGRGPPSLTL